MKPKWKRIFIEWFCTKTRFDNEAKGDKKMGRTYGAFGLKKIFDQFVGSLGKLYLVTEFCRSFCLGRKR